MCGRFTSRVSWSELHGLTALVSAPLSPQPRTNAAPGGDIVIVYARARRG